MADEYTIPAPKLGNQFLEDTALLDYLDYLVPQDILETAREDLVQLGDKVINECMDYATDAERSVPQLEQYNAFGERVDKIHTSWGWKKLKEFSAREGIIAYGYENHHGEYRRLLQFVRLYLFGPSSGLFNCPLAMTDGAAYLIKNTLKNPEKKIDEQVKKQLEVALKHLTSRDPKEFWTSGQWMTEIRGGSDVSGSTNTVAIHQNGPSFNLHGLKWFSSATDSNMAITLARIVPNKDVKFDDIKKTPLSLFFLKVRDENEKLNGIKVRRMKDKLGTRQLPTAELELDGTKALLASEPGKGIKSISEMINVTRIYNSVAYSKVRKAWGKYLKDLPLYNEILLRKEITFRGNLIFMLGVSRLFGFVEEGKATKDQINLFRIMTPVLKLFTAKEAVKLASESIESFGGQGYIESSGMPNIARDAQVLPIWEGTTNVLCYDFIRALGNDMEKLEAMARWFREMIRKILESDSEIVAIPGAREAAHSVIISFNNLYADLHDIITDPKNLPKYERNLRKICFTFARIYIGVHLGLASIHSGLTRDVFIFVQWINKDAPYQRYLTTKSKLELDFKLISDIANDQGRINRPAYLKGYYKPNL